MTFFNFHIIQTLPLHNLNRDQSGQPKSQFDGGVQRSRLSSQSIKRAARDAYLSGGAEKTVRTREAASITCAKIDQIVAEQGLSIDVDAAYKRAAKEIKGLSAGSDEKAAAESKDPSKQPMAFFTVAELEELAYAVVDIIQNPWVKTKGKSDKEPGLVFVKDARSAALDIACNGRMFAARGDLNTHAAIAAGHMVGTHQMALEIDYFSAVDDVAEGSGAGHLGLGFATSGTYYFPFSVDAAQLQRSWLRFGSESAADDLTRMITAYIDERPKGKINSFNASTDVTMVLLEESPTRHTYGFERPVRADNEGGYEKPSVIELARRRQQALAFDPERVGDAVIAGETYGADFGAKDVVTKAALVEHAVARILGR